MASVPRPPESEVVELIVGRVIDALRTELAPLLEGAGPDNRSERSLTVDDVAQRLGVARSTVYAHWREWGGYKLGDGATAPIRFEDAHLPSTATRARPIKRTPARRRARRRRRDLISDAPRFTQMIDAPE